MKREELEKQGLTKEQIDFVMAENGKDVEAQKGKTTSVEAERDNLKTQLGDANKQIESFKEMKPEDLKKAADDWKAKYDQAVADHQAGEKKRLFDAALDKGLVEAKAKNTKTVIPLLDLNGLKYNEADGSLVGLKEQLEKIRADEKNGFLFDPEGGEEGTPAIVTGGKTNNSGLDAFEAGLLKGARLDTKTKE